VLVRCPKDVAKVLVDRRVRLWHRAHGGYRIHDFLQWNKPASEIKEMQEHERVKKAKQQEYERVKKRRQRAKKKAVSTGDIPRDALVRARAVPQPQPQPRTTTTPDLSASNVPIPAAGGNGKGPIFACRRFEVWQWLMDDLKKLLGPSFDAFDLSAWFHTLEARADTEGLVLHKREAGRWIYDATVEEAERRGLRIASSRITVEDLVGPEPR
jgi:hypothetical protein